MVSAHSFCCIGLAMLIRFSVPPIELTGDVTVTKLDLRPIQSRLASIVESKTQTAVLQLDDVVADRAPGIFWEVYVGPSGVKHDPRSAGYVGNVVLYGAGIRNEARGELKPAHFALPLNRALRAARKNMKNGELVVIFVPRGNDVNGRATHPQPFAPVRIGHIGIGIESQGR